MANYIKVDRKIVDWEWYKDICTKTAFIHCLVKANWKDGNFKGQTIPRGSFVTGRTKFATETGLTEQQVRTAWNKLKSTNEITINSTNKFTIITVNNYDLYQVINQEDNQQITNKQPTNNQQITTIEEYKNINIKESITKVIPKKSESSKNDIQKFFEDIWKLYPKKRGKGQVSDSKKKVLFEIGFDELSRAIERYKAEHNEVQYMQNGSTFFTSGYVDYLDENYSKLPSDKKSKQSFDQRNYDYDDLEKQLIANRRKANND